MPWARTNWMSERVKFIAADFQYEGSFSDLCLELPESEYPPTSRTRLPIRTSANVHGSRATLPGDESGSAWLTGAGAGAGTSAELRSRARRSAEPK